MIESVLGWLIDFHCASARPAHDVVDWYEKLIEHSLLHLERLFPKESAESSWIRGTRRLLEPLRDSGLCLVFEHGDFSSPNILVSDQDSISVVDWELAESVGLPALDAFFFLNFAAFSKSRARSNRQYIDAFSNAFFGADGWALPYLRKYCLKLGLDCNFLRPLFVFCWARYVANLALRLRKSPDSNAVLSDESISWLRQNRYYKLWEFALTNSDGLSFNSAGPRGF